ncbi:MAG TPA: hypothetical protein VJ731_01580 [Terriglobales bacterium]|nr:hypothetical protein [Terriglobales bacterium]
MTDPSDSHRGDVFPIWIRGLAITTGFLAFSSVFLGWGSLAESTCLVAAAVVQPRTPRLGRWLTWVSAFLLTQFAVVFAIPASREIKAAGFTRADIASWIVIFFLVLLMLVLDIALVVDCVRSTRLQARGKEFRRDSINWVIWAAAALLSAYYGWFSFWTVRAYQLRGRADMAIVNFVGDLVVLGFDVALIFHVRSGLREP